MIISLYIIGFLGFLLNRRHAILALLSIELMLLGITLFILLNNISDMSSMIIGIYSIILAGSESAIGLSLIINYNRSHGQIFL